MQHNLFMPINIQIKRARLRTKNHLSFAQFYQAIKMEKLKSLLKELENKIPQHTISHAAVSKSSVGWHIEHSLLTMHLILEALKNSNPNDYQKTFNFKRMMVFAMNKIPRGKAKAPNAVLPKHAITEETIKEHLQKMSTKLNDLNTLDPNNFFAHPIFGHLNVQKTKKLFVIHTKHHLQIINDIIQAKA